MCLSENLEEGNYDTIITQKRGMPSKEKSTRTNGIMYEELLKAYH